MEARDGEAAPVGAAEDEVRHLLAADADVAEDGAVGGVAADADAGARPDIAGLVDAEPVEDARLAGREEPPAGEAPVVGDVEDAHGEGQAADMGAAGLDDVEAPLVGREGEPVRLDEVVRDEGDRAGKRIGAVDVLPADLGGAAAAELRVVGAVGGVGEPDGAVRLHHDVVRAVEAPAVIAVGDDGDRAVGLGPRHPPAAALAGDEAALAVDGVAVGEAARRAEDADLSRAVVVAEKTVAGDVAEDERAVGGKPGRPLAEIGAGPERDEGRLRPDQGQEGGIVDRVGLVHRLPSVLSAPRRHPARGHVPSPSASPASTGATSATSPGRRA